MENFNDYWRDGDAYHDFPIQSRADSGSGEEGEWHEYDDTEDDYDGYCCFHPKGPMECHCSMMSKEHYMRLTVSKKIIFFIKRMYWRVRWKLYFLRKRYCANCESKTFRFYKSNHGVCPKCGHEDLPF